MKRCKTCKYFNLDGKVFGECSSPKFDYGYETEQNYGVKYEDDMLLYMDYEGYNANFQVGENFGCIHHESGKAKR